MFARHQRTLTRAPLLAVLGLAVLGTSGVAQQPSGAEAWSTNCGRCHRVRAVDAYNAREWESVVVHMALTARLTRDETEAVREFLVGAARSREASAAAAAARPRRQPIVLASAAGGVPVVAGEACCTVEVGRRLFQAQCVACHGQRGKGDGPAAVAMNPRPSDLTGAVVIQASDDSLRQIVAAGRKGMPGFGRTLDPEQIREVLAYLRTLQP